MTRFVFANKRESSSHPRLSEPKSSQIYRDRLEGLLSCMALSTPISASLNETRVDETPSLRDLQAHPSPTRDVRSVDSSFAIFFHHPISQATPPCLPDQVYSGLKASL